MTYLRSIFLNFLVVFFIDRMAPGIEIQSYEQVPSIGADLFFSGLVGFLNASVFPFLFILDIKCTKLKIGILTFLISFIAFLTIALVPFGVRAVSTSGVIVGTFVVWIVAFFSNYLEWKEDRKKNL